MKNIQVAALILENAQRRILVGQRKSNDTSPGKWEFPGGKLEEGETFEDALRREIKEELHLEVPACSFFEKIEHLYPERKTLIHFFYAQCSRLDIMHHPEHAQVMWVDRSELSKLDLLEANQRLLPRLLRMR